MNALEKEKNAWQITLEDKNKRFTRCRPTNFTFLKKVPFRDRHVLWRRVT